MATLELKYGDLFEIEADAIGHGTNTHGAMASGIAVIFKKKFPNMHETYQELCEIFGDSLGGRSYIYSGVDIAGEGYSHVANIFSQKAPGANAEIGLLIDGVKDTFVSLRGELEIDEPHLAIPLIGCGIGGLSWDDVHPAMKILAESFPEGWKLTVVSNEPREGFEE